VLSPDQLEAVAHPGGPLLVVGGAGTGKTRTLVARFAHLVEHGVAPEQILALTLTHRAADELRDQVELALARPFEELSVTTFHGFCAQLLRDEALDAGIDPFATPVSPGERLAMLLERIDELPLSQHDLRGNPSVLIGAIVKRIDRLKDELITPGDYEAWAATLPEDSDGARARREREFAAIYAAHDAMLADAGTLDFGDLVLHSFRLLRERPHVRARLGQRFTHVLVDEYQDTNFAQGLLLRLLVTSHSNITAAGDDDQAIHRFRGAATKNLRDFPADFPGATVVRLEESFRAGRRILDAATAVVAPVEQRIVKPLEGPDGGDVRFWRCGNERAQAQAAAADIERLITREGVAPEDVCVLVRSVKGEGQAVAVALEERAVPHQLTGAAAFFQRAEVRDLLAWLRLLADPGDAGAVVRALARPPIELRSIDLARVTQIARRRKLDMVGALGAALESPQIPPEARERIIAFLKLYRSASSALDSSRPDLFVHRMVERLGLRRQLLFAASAEVVERLTNLARFAELAAAYARRSPQATAREFARSIAAVAEAGLREEDATEHVRRGVQVMSMHAAKGSEFDHVYVLGLFAARMPGPRRRTLEPIPDALIKEAVPPDTKAAHVAEQRRLLHVAMTRARRRLVLAYPELTDRGAAQVASPFVEEAREAVGGEWEAREEELFGPAETLQSTFRMLRDELMTTIAQVGGRLGELRFDTDLDVSHAVVRQLELLKLSALLERTRNGQTVAEALPEINARILQSITSEQREIFETSALDDYLLDAERDETLRARAVARPSEPSLEGFLPRRGDGLLLSASDIDTYRTCPLKYKFARVFRIPSEPTLYQRFGILVHQVLERFHAGESPSRSLPEMLGLLEAGWRRGGFGDSEEEKQLRGKAEQALIRYHGRFQGEDAEPVWFEKSFSFSLGKHTLRGRVDRVDRLADGGYELIDYKTGRPKKPADLRDDVQLALYSVAARESWRLEAAQQSYYYVLDDKKVPVDWSEDDRDWIQDTVLEVAGGIESQGFEPTPSYSACSMCDYRIACPAAER
jgi:DNA helicase-2/ATP-dependent DNA helicase PcrA